METQFENLFNSLSDGRQQKDSEGNFPVVPDGIYHPVVLKSASLDEGDYGPYISFQYYFPSLNIYDREFVGLNNETGVKIAHRKLSMVRSGVTVDQIEAVLATMANSVLKLEKKTNGKYSNYYWISYVTAEALKF